MDFVSIINQWPSVGDLAADLHHRNRRVPQIQLHQRINKWATRNSIPSSYWADLLDAAQERGIPVSHETLLSASRKAA